MPRRDGGGMSDALADAKHALLGMLGGAAPGPDLDWPTIAAMAAAQRLEPLLAWRASADGWAVPDEVASAWDAARRTAALHSLGFQAALRLAGERLDAAGIGWVALKGVALAWHDYPAPELRPMRDIDLLVARADVLRAAGVLAATGFTMPGSDAAAVAEALRQDKHLPPLEHAGLGVTIELHHALSDAPERHGYRTPQLDPAAMLAGREALAVGGALVPCPANEDLLAHLMVHALYGHRLDCGPLVLADIHFLLAARTIDWNVFVTTAQAQGWERGAALLLALTARHFGPQAHVLPIPPEAILAAAQDALLADPATRDHAEALADLTAARSPAALAQAVRRRLKPDRQVVASESKGAGGGWAFWLVWVARRLARLTSRLGDRRARREARGAAAVIRWLQS